jgi:hypothetical protein
MTAFWVLLGIIPILAFHDHDIHLDWEAIEKEASMLAWLGKD